MKKLAIICVLCLLAICLCACGNVCNHDYETKVEKPASCTEKGIKIRTCTRCGVQKTVEVDMLEHEAVVDAAVSAGCIRFGLTEGSSCGICGQVLVAQEKLPMLGHVYGKKACVRCGSPVPSEGLNYRKEGEGYVVTGLGTCRDTHVVIPETYDGLPVIGIEDSAFRGEKRIEKIDFPYTLTFIGEKAFAKCNALESVEIPDGVVEMGERAFEACRNLRSVKIGGGLTSISRFAFADCTALMNVELSEGTKEIGYGAFELCSNLRNVRLPKGLTTIGPNAFLDCTWMTGIELPDTLITIEYNAFAECRSLSSVTIPDSVTSIGNNCFLQCQGLTEVTIGAGVASIGAGAFGSCSSLKKVNFRCPDGWQADENALFTKPEKMTGLANAADAASLLRKNANWHWRREP